MNAKRKSYRASSRRHRILEDGTVEYGDPSEGEDGESTRGKLARLKREVRELEEEARRNNEDVTKATRRRQGAKAERAAKQAAESDRVKVEADDTRADVSDDEAEGLVDGQEVMELSKILDGISIAQTPRSVSSGAQLARHIVSTAETNGTPQNATEDSATYTVTYAPSSEQDHALAKAADFDSRLTLLEKALGINTTLPGDAPPTAVLPTLDTIQRQVSVLSESTPSSLDGISRRVRTLTQEAERLEESRKAAKTAQDALKAAGGDTIAELGEDSAQASKVNALYGTLTTIEQLSPLLPALLDRLRSLRAMHAEAATASESLGKFEQRQTAAEGELKRWREGLGKIEEAIKQNEKIVGGNMKAVECWIEELETRMGRL